MENKLIAPALAVLAFGFGFAPSSNAGTEIVRDYGAAAPNYNYVPPPPPPPPVYYVPPPPVSVVVYPTYAYYGYGPRVGVYGAHRFYGRRAFFHPHHHYWH